MVSTNRLHITSLHSTVVGKDDIKFKSKVMGCQVQLIEKVIIPILADWITYQNLLILEFT